MSIPSAVAEKEKEILEKYYSGNPEEEKKQDDQKVEAPDQAATDAPPLDEAATTENPPDQNAEVERLKAELERAQQAYNTLRGKYDSELPELYRSVKALTEEVASLKSAPAPQKPAETVPEVVTALQESHPAMVEAITYLAKKAASEAINSAVSDTVKPLEERLNMTARTVKETAEERFERTLDEQVKGDWRMIDKDPKFIEWLNVSDRYTGVTRLDLLRRAYQSGLAGTVANFFNDYLSETGQLNNPAPPKSKSNLVAPSSSSNKAKQPVPTEIEPISRRDLVQFSNDLISGKYVGREEEQKKMQAKIDRAIAAGRITD